jgi:acetyltransferase-like isoleucine patch superfamily enzyme
MSIIHSKSEVVGNIKLEDGCVIHPFVKISNHHASEVHVIGNATFSAYLGIMFHVIMFF